MNHLPRIRRTCLLGVVIVVVGAEAMVPMSAPISPIIMQDSILRDTAMVDTLRELTVMGDSLRVAPVKDAISQSLKRNGGPKQVTLGDVLNKVAPGTMDYILHPFGFAERKKKKKKKRMNQILQQFDQVDQRDAFARQLDSIMRLEGLK